MGDGGGHCMYVKEGLDAATWSDVWIHTRAHARSTRLAKPRQGIARKAWHGLNWFSLLWAHSSCMCTSMCTPCPLHAHHCCRGMPCRLCKILHVGNYLNPNFGLFVEVCCSVPPPPPCASTAKVRKTTVTRGPRAWTSPCLRATRKTKRHCTQKTCPYPTPSTSLTNMALEHNV